MLVDRDLIHRLERSDSLWLAQSVSAAGGDVLRAGGGTAAYCGERNVLTQVVAVTSPGELDQVFGHFRDRTSAFEFKLSPMADPEIRREVAERALDVAEFETILVHPLDPLPPLAPEVNIEALPRDEVRPYVELSMRWFYPDAPPPGFVDTISASSLLPISRTFVVRSSGRIVGGASLTVSDGVAWLHGGAVDPRFRRRGIHRALIAHRLHLAREYGGKLAAQGAEPGSASQLNAQRNGFEIAFTRPSLWVRP